MHKRLHKMYEVITQVFSFAHSNDAMFASIQENATENSSDNICMF